MGGISNGIGQILAGVLRTTRLGACAGAMVVFGAAPSLAEQHDPGTLGQDRIEIREALAQARAAGLSGEVETAIAIVDGLLERSPDLEPRERLRALSLMTNLLVVYDRFEEGFGYFRAALDLAPDVEDLAMRADTYSVAAELHHRIGESSTAADYAERALALADRGNHVRQRCIALERLGRAQASLELHDPAMRSLRDSATACDESSEEVFAGLARLGLAKLATERGDEDVAGPLLREAIRRFQAHGYAAGVLEARTLQARRALADGDAERALGLLDTDRNPLEGIGDHATRAEAHRILADAHRALGQEARAARHLRAALKEREEKSSRQRAMRLALLLAGQDRDDRSQEISMLRERNRAMQLERESRQQGNLGLLYAGTGIAGAGLLLFFVLFQTARDQRRFRRLSQQDGLTGLHNHTSFFERALQAFEKSLATSTPFTLVIADIDLFKQVNDRHGHLVGDAILRRVGSRFREAFGENVILGRLGGEEFGAALPGSDVDDAVARIEHLRAIVNRRRESEDEPEITLSFGVAERGSESSLDLLYSRADQALYDAKEAGRNRVITVARMNLTPSPYLT
ncbi:MAG: diguanylate cyclase [Wenzhouxiangellaceae bacterium]|nr:diguanylate cyclase [Wenzhouxiangellaceae bacterium]